MKRFIGFAVIFCMVFSFYGPALATVVLELDQDEVGGGEEEPAAVEQEEIPTGEADSWMTCHQLGKQDGGNISTGGSVAAGLAGGLLLGLIGTGIVVLVQSDSEPSQLELKNLEGDECQYAYLEAYKNKSVGKKRKSALIGGLVGTAILVLIIVSSGD
jgi:hypothetical protein